MNGSGFVISLGLSSAIVGITLAALILYAVRNPKTFRLSTSIPYVTMGIAAALLVLLFPVCYYHELAPVREGWRLVFSGCMAMIQTVRVFLVDAEFENVVAYLVANGQEQLLDWCRLLFTFLSIVAPILTAGALLTLVNELWVRLRLCWLRGKRVYAFNELSERSLALAQSIAQKAENALENAKKEKRPLREILELMKEKHKIVFFFTDVFEQDDEVFYELTRRAKELAHAHCCKRDIVKLDETIRHRVFRSPETLEYFMVSEDEAENVNHAIEICNSKLHNNRVAPHVYAVAVGSANSEILDSLNQFCTDTEGGCAVLEEEARQAIPALLKDPKQSACLKDFEDAADQAMACTEKLTTFFSRRVHPMQRLAWDELKRAKLQETAGEDKTISILLVGCGHHGIEFLKAAIWLYQLPDYRLEINVVDQDKDIQDKVEGVCPEIMRASDLTDPGESQYSLRFYGGVDVMRQSFWQMLEDPEAAVKREDLEVFRKLKEPERLRRTTAVFVALGNDDRDIEVAMRLRMLFDRLEDGAAKKGRKIDEERVRIYSIVYSESKRHNLSAHHQLANCKEVPYNIAFIGSLTDMYNYERVTYREEERNSFKHHVHWIYNDRQYISSDWYDPLSELLKYRRYEYFRIASMAQEWHRDFFSSRDYPSYFEDPETEPQKVGLRNENGRIIEHRRWNAFMRSQGHLYGPRDDRAKTHNNLVPYGELTEGDQMKDA